MAGINIRQKGANGERQVIAILEEVLYAVLRHLEADPGTIQQFHKVFQRNQNQSAVGGNDITGTLGLSVEVKRQEQLAINTWWEQTTAAAKKNGEWPVLIFKQNHKPWRVITNMWMPTPSGGYIVVRAEVDIDTFKLWCSHWFREKIVAGWRPQS